MWVAGLLREWEQGRGNDFGRRMWNKIVLWYIIWKKIFLKNNMTKYVNLTR